MNFVASGSTMQCMAFQLLFAMVFAATAVGLLDHLGIFHPQQRCPCMESDGYSWCAIWQDMRSLLSFAFGMAMCTMLVGKEHADEDTDAVADETRGARADYCVGKHSSLNVFASFW